MSNEEIKQKILELIKEKKIISKRELLSLIENREELERVIFDLLSNQIIYEINILGGNYYGFKSNNIKIKNK